MMEIGFHTDAFNSVYWNFEQCLEWAQQHGVHWIECHSLDGVSGLHGLGYHPHIALWEDPIQLRTKMDQYDVAFSQLDAAFPLLSPEGGSIGLEYVLHTIRWAKLVGCPRVDTTDGHEKPSGMSDRESLQSLRRIYERILRIAELHQITINIEPHGNYTTNADLLEEILSFSNSPLLKVNMDVGNTFIAGLDPVAFTKRFLDRTSHVHLKDVSPSLVAEARGQLLGVAGSHCAIGEGVNAENVRKCVQLLAEHGYEGILSIECEAHGGPLLERSVEWVRNLLAEIRIARDTSSFVSRQ
jgi:sugar phosphate isomerase/epimerase